MKYLLLLYMALPVFVANSAPVVASRWNWLERLNVPIDGNKTFRGRRIFGDHKTLRGFVIGIDAALICACIQYLLDERGIIAFPHLVGAGQFLLYGFLCGFGSLVGDAVESFVKRQVGIKSGHPFLPFDQIDYMIGFLLCTSFLISWNSKEALFFLLCGLVINPIVNVCSYFLGIKKTYW